MGTFLSTAGGLALIYGATAGFEMVMARYATPEASSAEQSQLSVSGRQRRARHSHQDDVARP